MYISLSLSPLCVSLNLYVFVSVLKMCLWQGRPTFFCPRATLCCLFGCFADQIPVKKVYKAKNLLFAGRTWPTGRYLLVYVNVLYVYLLCILCIWVLIKSNGMQWGFFTLIVKVSCYITTKFNEYFVLYLQHLISIWLKMSILYKLYVQTMAAKLRKIEVKREKRSES